MTNERRENEDTTGRPIRSRAVPRPDGRGGDAVPPMLAYGRGRINFHGGGDGLARVAAFATPAFAYLATVFSCKNAWTAFPPTLGRCVGVVLCAIPVAGTACGVIAFLSTRPRRRRRLVAVVVNGVVAMCIALAIFGRL